MKESSIPYAIYGLVDPRTQIVKYVGLSKDPQKRYKQHWNAALVCLAPWFVELRAAGLKPALQILDYCEDRQSAEFAEERWIRKYRCDVLNSQRHLRLHPSAPVKPPLRRKPPTLDEWQRYLKERGLPDERVRVQRRSLWPKRASAEIPALEA